jgi:spore germination protein
MIRNFIITILVIGLVGFGYWGYIEHRDKNALIIQNENNYQQAFHELSYYVDKIHDDLGTSLATDPKSTSAPQLTEVWKLTGQAREDIGKLPLKLMPLSNTSTFLSNVGNYSFNTAVKHPSVGGLSQKDYHQLETLYSESATVEKDLRHVQSVILTNNLKWTDVAAALQTNQPKDNQIIDGLKTVNAKTADFDKKWQPTANQPTGSLKLLDNLTGQNINKGDAIRISKQFIGIHAENKVDVQKVGTRSSYSGYNVTFSETNNNNESTTAALTRKGGHMVWFMKNRSIGTQKLSLHQATGKAQNYLKAKGFDSLNLVSSDQYDTVGVLAFAKKEKNVLIYPASIKVKVALDNGEILGFDQTEYLITQKTALPRLQPNLTEKEAQSKLRSTVHVQQQGLVVYKNEQGKNVLCYEFYATKGKDTYHIFINAMTGLQENVNLLTA